MLLFKSTPFSSSVPIHFIFQYIFILKVHLSVHLHPHKSQTHHPRLLDLCLVLLLPLAGPHHHKAQLRKRIWTSE